MEHWRRNQEVAIPHDFVYSKAALPCLSSEEVWSFTLSLLCLFLPQSPPPSCMFRQTKIEKLNKVRPRTFHEASQISGVTPHTLVYIYHLINRRAPKKQAQPQVATG